MFVSAVARMAVFPFCENICTLRRPYILYQLRNNLCHDVLFQMFIIFPEPTDVLCAITPWIHHTGFNLMYGALILKTWRLVVLLHGLFIVKAGEQNKRCKNILSHRYSMGVLCELLIC